MNKRLLILGTLGEFEQLVQKARARGIYTIVCDGYPDGPARAFADESYVIPVTDTDRIAALCKEKQVDGILTSFSDLLLECMVKISAKAGLPCYLNPEQLPWYRDKSATRGLLEELGLPSPGFAKIPTSGLAPELIAHLHFPLVTKPLDKYGSRGIYVVHTLEELKQAITETASFTDLPEILVEEYNDGYEFNMMTWVHKGKVHVISIADREKTDIGPGEIPISTRNVYPSCLYEQVVAPATDLLQCYADKTGQKEGALSMQFFWKPENGIQVCEIAARFFGYEHELTDIVYGFSIEDLLLNYLYDVPALEQMLNQHDPQKPICHGAVLYFQGRLLQICDLSIPQKLSSHPAVKKPWIFYHEGETVIAHGPNPYVALYYISCPSRKELDQVTDEIFTSMTIPSSDGKEVLYRNRMTDYPKTKL